MPKSESSSTPKVRQERWARGPVAVSKKKANGKGKGKASRPVVSVTYEDGSGPSNGSGPNGKGKSKAHDADGDFEIEDGQDEDQEEEDIKPDIVDTQVPAPPSIVNENKSSSSSSFIIVAGSYEKNLYGLQASFKKDSLVPTLEPIFIFPAHISCIKAAAAAPLGARWLATGSDDEIVKIWDLRRRKEVGGLSQHVGSITALTFPTRSHLLSASEDSTISLFRTKDWALLRTLKGHSGRVNFVDVHPSGKVALSVGKDKTLKMWDLMRGRGAASLALGVEAEVVKFAKSGRYFGVLSPNGIEIYSTKMKLLSSVTYPKRLHDIVFCQIDDEDVMLTGSEDGKLLVYSVDPKLGICELKGHFGGHSNRIKSISHLTVSRPSKTLELATTVSSDGKINVYDLSLISEADDLQPIASYDTRGSRLVCCCVSQLAEPRKQGPPRVAVKPEDGSEAGPTSMSGAVGGEEDEDEDMYGETPLEDDEEEEEDEDEQEQEVEED